MVAAFAMLASLCGILVALPLLRRASKVHGAIHVAVIDGCCLVAIVGTLSTLTWNRFPEGDKTDGIIYVLAICMVGSIWWFVVAVSMSRLGIVSSLNRAAYQMFVVPCAFVAPFFVLINAIMVLQSQSVRPPMSVERELIQIVVCVSGFCACIPLTKWLVGQSNGRSANTAT